MKPLRATAVAALAALIVLCVAWELWLAPLRPGGSWWALKVLPLALPLAGLLRLRLYTYRWTSLLVWLYVGEGLMRAGSEHGMARALALAQVLLATALFGACVLHVRWRLTGAVAR